MKASLLVISGLLLLSSCLIKAEPVGSCSQQNGDDAILLEDSDDCSVFYYCNWGDVFKYQCPHNLLFDKAYGTCVSPDQATCYTNKVTSEGNKGDDKDSTPAGNDIANVVGECPPVNGVLAVHLSHKTNCELFYECDNGKLVLKECPAHLHFNPNLQVCDYPERAGCQSGSVTESGNGSWNQSGEVEEGEHDLGPDNEDVGSELDQDDENVLGKCPLQNGELPVYLPHKSNCELFYECDGGKAFLFKCPENLHFNPTLHVCDYPESAGCQSSSGNESENGNLTQSGEVEEEDDDAGPNNGNGSEDKDNRGELDEDDENVLGKCPLQNGELPVYLPHKSNCELFYECDGGKAFLFACPENLHFNPTLHVCDYPESAGCQSGSDSESGNGSSNQSGEIEEEDDAGSNNGIGNEDEDNGSEIDQDDENVLGKCPLQNGELPVYLPHKSNCELFYECDGGKAFLFACPENLHFNPTSHVCDYPESAGCQSGSESESGNGSSNQSGEVEEEDDAGSNNGIGNEDEDNGSEIDQDDENVLGKCPLQNGELPVYLPHKSNCELFYECDGGKAFLFACPENLHFNPTLHVCDYPESAGCQSGSESESGNGSSNQSGEVEEEDEAGSNNGIGNEDEDNGSEIDQDDESVLGKCPLQNGELPVYLPHKSNCELFYECDGGKAFLFACPENLHFNPTSHVCDYPESAGCQSGSESESGNGSSNQSGEVEEEDDAGSNNGIGNEDEDNGSEIDQDDENVLGKCPLQNGELPVYLPHKSNCELFYECDGGKAFLFACPENLHFNPTSHVCDYPESAGCQSGSESESGNGSSNQSGEVEEEEDDAGSNNGIGNEDEDNGSEIDQDDENVLGKCPLQNGELPVYLPHKSNCELFYECDGGKAFLFACPENLHFNPTSHVCDYPESAGCQSGSESESGNGSSNQSGEVEEEDDAGSNNGIGNEDEDNGSEIDQDDENVLGKCPLQNGELPVYLPHKSNCELFYECDGGKAFLFACPENLHFNPTLHVCDYPESAGCQSGSESESGNGSSNQSGEVEEEEDDAGSNDGIGNEDEDNGSEIDQDDESVLGKCPLQNGELPVYLPHKSNCELFYECDGGKAFLFACPENLHFNPTSHVCDYPESAGCQSGSDSESGNGSSNQSVEVEEEDDAGSNNGIGNEDEDNGSEIDQDDENVLGKCPLQNGELPVYLPHKSNCELFYECDGGKAFLFACPENLHFNPTSHVCDYPESAGCQSGSESESGNGSSNQSGEVEEEDDAGSNNGIGNEDEDNGSEIDQDDENVLGKCPLQNGELPVYLPHKSNCELFYECDGGKAFLFACPENLHFNPTLHVCDYPESAGCQSGSESESGNGSSNQSGEVEEEDEAGSNNGIGNEDEDNGSEIDQDDESVLGKCPLQNGELPVYLPHKSNCELFYECDGGKAFLFACPENLHFNPTSHVCDYPESAGCQSGSESESGNGSSNQSGEVEEEDDAGSNNGIGNEDEDNGSEIDQDDENVLGKCPLQNGELPVYLPHKSNCELFYECDGGKAFLFACPENLHFNPTSHVCDYPESAGCQSGSESESGNGSSNQSGEVEEEEDDAGSNNGIGNEDEDNGSEIDQDDENVLGKCPLQNGELPVYLPHKSNCELFYECDGGKAFLFACPENLHFNPTSHVCDYPESAGCQSGSESESGNGSSNQSGEVEEEDDAGSNNGIGNEDEDNGSEIDQDDENVLGKCPLQNGELPVYLPHKSNCELFYECDGGKAFLFACPENLHFNPTLHVCDYPESAGCQSGSESESGNGSSNQSGEVEEEDDAGSNNGIGNEDEDNGSEIDQDDESVLGKCPLQNGELPVYLPHKSNCELFYECDGGKAFLFACPENLHFNPTSHVCDYPESAGCQSGSESESGNGSSNQSGEVEEEDDAGSNNGIGNEDEDNGSEIDQDDENVLGKCPLQNAELPVYLPHKSNCELFYECDGGKAFLFACPENLHFNPTSHVCDYPESAGCQSGSESESGNGSSNQSGEVEEEDDAGSNNGIGNEDEDNGSEIDQDDENVLGKCPLQNGELPVYLPHKSNCELFYECDGGKAFLFACPENLHFNPTLHVCDYPESAGCQSSSGSEPGNGSSNQSGEVEEEDDDAGFNNGIGNEDEDNGSEIDQDDENVLGKCPLQNGELPVYLPHKSDCELFYECDGGKAFLFKCPENLHFNPTSHVCDYPESAGCQSGTRSESENGNLNQSGEVEEEEADAGSNNGNGSDDEDNGSQVNQDDENVLGKCPTQNGDLPIYLPHKSNCELFYECNGGKAFLFKCPENLHFNPTLHICDYPESAGCQSGSGSKFENAGPNQSEEVEEGGGSV